MMAYKSSCGHYYYYLKNLLLLLLLSEIGSELLEKFSLTSATLSPIQPTAGAGPEAAMSTVAQKTGRFRTTCVSTHMPIFCLMATGSYLSQSRR